MNDAAHADLARTPLYELHRELGAKLVPFAGYELPVQYALGIRHEHLVTRSRAGLFDVSHMGQISLEVPAAALEDLVPSDIEALAAGQQRYTVLTNPDGGILDDLMVTRLPDRLYAVVNAAFKAADLAHFERAFGRAKVTLHTDRALLALQGPAAAGVLERLWPAAAELAFMHSCEARIADIHCFISRCGYTGEDGFEIAVDNAVAERLARLLLAHDEVEAAGLGARDSLRLEAGLCLSGSDIDSSTTPIEAGLGWLVAAKYRGADPVPARFPGADVILEQQREGTRRIRVGLRPLGRVPLRAGVELHGGDGGAVGRITSGTFGPSVDGPIAMGYVDRAHSAPGSALTATIRGRRHEVTVAKLPFVAHRQRK